MNSQEQDRPIMVSEQMSGQATRQVSEQALQIIAFN